MIRENILEIRKSIISACLKAKRDPASIKIIAVSKNRSVEELKEVFLAGITAFGENRVQEALLKYRDMQLFSREESIKWHMVGHLQTNKVKDAVRIFDLIHSVDSLRLAEEINKQSAKINKVQDILLEVKTSPEETKSGLRPEEVIDFLKVAAQFKNIKVKGLMTIAPLLNNPELARPYFKKLRELGDKIHKLQVTSCKLEFLSMGMTDDFQVAIEEGSNMVRLGRAIFERNQGII